MCRHSSGNLRRVAWSLAEDRDVCEGTLQAPRGLGGEAPAGVAARVGSEQMQRIPESSEGRAGGDSKSQLQGHFLGSTAPASDPNHRESSYTVGK